MALTVFLCGHGSWRPLDGYVAVPKGCSVRFMINFAKLLPTQDMYRICEGSYPGAPESTIGEYKLCPNMKWDQDHPSKITECAKRLAKNNGVGDAINLFPNELTGIMAQGQNFLTLSRFFEMEANWIRNTLAQYKSIVFVWNCCGALDLNHSGLGAEIGVNAGQFSDKYMHLDLTGGNINPTGKTTPKP